MGENRNSVVSILCPLRGCTNPKNYIERQFQSHCPTLSSQKVKYWNCIRLFKALSRIFQYLQRHQFYSSFGQCVLLFEDPCYEKYSSQYLMGNLPGCNLPQSPHDMSFWTVRCICWLLQLWSFEKVAPGGPSAYQFPKVSSPEVQSHYHATCTSGYWTPPSRGDCSQGCHQTAPFQMDLDHFQVADPAQHSPNPAPVHKKCSWSTPEIS